MTDWIRSEDRLPDDGVDVLVWTPWQPRTAEVRYIRRFTSTRVDGSTVVTPMWYAGGATVGHTKWCPLPPLPNEEGR